MKKINVLSLFDGICSGRVALQRAGIPVNKYYASEIDKYAIMITQNNFPDTIQLGDVTKWEDWDIDWGSIDLLIGGSPCFTAGTLVMTPTGFKNIEDIQVGDYVLTHKSRYRKVLKTGHKQVNTVYNIKGMGLHNLETTQEHPFYIRERYRVWDNENRTYSRLFKAPEWKKACELNKNTFLGSTYNTANTKSGIFKATDKNFWYYVGRFTADGWTTKVKRKHRKNSYLYKVMLCCGKRDFEDCKTLLDSIGYNYCITEERTVYKFCISNQSLLEYLEKIKKGALNKIIHPDVWNLPLESKKAFIEGYISGDGHIYKNGVISATSISKNLIYGLKMLINEVYNRPCGIHLTKRKPTSIIEGRIVNQHNTYEIRFKYINDKQDKGFYEDNYTWCPTKNIQPQQKTCVVYNLEVEEDNSYTANTIVVHNCQGFSFAGKQLNFNDPRSKLFFDYVNILRHIQKYNPNVKFLLENVKMKQEFQDIFSDMLGVQPVEINSALLSAQNRKRLYWTNWEFGQPEDKHIMLKDIVHEYSDELPIKYTERNMRHYKDLNDKSLCCTATMYKGAGNNGMTLIFEKLQEYIVPFDKTLQILDKEVKRGKVGYFGKDSQANRVYYIHDKAVTLCGSAGGGAAKMGQYLFGCLTPDRVNKRQNEQRFNEGDKFYTLTAQDKHGVLVEGYIRKLTPVECERLQTLEDGFTANGVDQKTGKVVPISNTQRYKALGNGWTVDVIAHILKSLDFGE